MRATFGVILPGLVLVLGVGLAEQGHGADPDTGLRMTVTTETGGHTHAGTDDLRIFIVLNDDVEHKQELDDPKRDDFIVGAVEKFEGLRVSCPLDQIEKIGILVDGGKDAWLLRELSVQFFQDGKKTGVVSFKTKTWFSCEDSDRHCRDKKTFRLQHKDKRLLRLQ